MNTPLIILCTLITVLASTQSHAQYVPKSERKSVIKLHSIKIKKGKEVTARRSVIYCDTLIMEDQSVLKIPHTFKSFTLYAKHCLIGKQCTIFARGKNGKVSSQAISVGESGTDAPHLNLYLNIFKLGNLTVNATGGNGGTGKLPGVYGSGGNVSIIYFSPLVVNLNTKRRQNKAPEIFVKNSLGKMLPLPNNSFRRGRWTNARKYVQDLSELSTQNSLANNRQRQKHQKRVGRFTFKRKSSVILPSGVKFYKDRIK